MIKEFILQNWSLLLILIAFAALLKSNVFLDKKTVRRMYVLIISVFLLSVIVFTEFCLEGRGTFNNLRIILMAIRYSATPFIIAMTLYTLAKKERWFIFIPAILFTLLNILSLFNGLVFSLADDGKLLRGPLGYLPYVAVGGYCVFLVFSLLQQGNKLAGEIFPTLFLCLAFGSGLILPFVIGKDYSKIFCTNIAIALFVYYDFSILQITKKDPLTGLLNRQAYDSAIHDNKKNISSLISIDMNGLKEINDVQGHAAGDDALETVALCFARATKPKELAYRIGGDEFMIICRHTGESEVERLIERIRKNISKTKYHCAIGYSYTSDGSKTIDEMLKESDEKMYLDKEAYYIKTGKAKYRS